MFVTTTTTSSSVQLEMYACKTLCPQLYAYPQQLTIIFTKHYAKTAWDIYNCSFVCAQHRENGAGRPDVSII